jgi:hypothetical protein
MKKRNAKPSKAEADMIEHLCLEMVEEGILVIKGTRDDGRIVFAEAEPSTSEQP